MTPKPHELLASAIEARRSELGLSLRKVAELAGVTGETLRAVRNGSNEPSSLTKSGIERALQWEPGSVAEILRGGEPASRPPRRSPMDEAEEIAAENEQRAAQLAARIGRLRRDQRRLVDDLVRMLEADAPGSQDHDRNPR